MHSEGVVIDSFLVKVDFPEFAEDGIEFDDMVTFKVFCIAAGQTHCGFVSSTPVIIGYGHSDSLFHCS